MANETMRLAEYAVNLRYEDIPAAVIERVKHTITDTVGAIIFGSELPWSKMIIDYATTYGGNGRSRILSPEGALIQAPLAALANGALAHAFELDAGVEPSVGAHPGSTIFPAALALAQERGFGGRDLITAFVAASEVMLRIGSATKHSNEARGFHAPGTTGPFGAAVAAGRLLQFDVAKMANVMGIAASLACGLVQFARAGTGAMVKRLHFGRANESGIIAANLADRGFTGPHDVIEGEFGFLRVFCNEWDMNELVQGLGDTYLCMNIYMKRFACHGSSRNLLKSLQEIKATKTFSPSDIESIQVGGSRDVLERHSRLDPRDAIQAQYSVPFCIALACFRDPKDPRSFDQSALDDPNINTLSKRVLIHLDENASHARPSRQIKVYLHDGRILEHPANGHDDPPDRSLDSNDVNEKFSVLTGDHPLVKMKEMFRHLQNIEFECNFDWLHL